MAENQINQKSSTIYLLLAFFFGYLGLHNFYAGFIKTGLTQLILSIFSAYLIASFSPYLFIGLLIYLFIWFWIFFEICFVYKDGNKKQMTPSPILRAVLIIIDTLNMIFFMVWAFMGTYEIATNRFFSDKLINYAIQTNKQVQKDNTGKVIYEEDCSTFNDEKLLPAHIKCTVYKEVSSEPILLFSNVKPDLINAVAQENNPSFCLQATDDNNIILDFNIPCL